jgi:hypothetical protein
MQIFAKNSAIVLYLLSGYHMVEVLKDEVKSIMPSGSASSSSSASSAAPTCAMAIEAFAAFREKIRTHTGVVRRCAADLQAQQQQRSSSSSATASRFDSVARTASSASMSLTMGMGLAPGLSGSGSAQSLFEQSDSQQQVDVSVFLSTPKMLRSLLEKVCLPVCHCFALLPS